MSKIKKDLRNGVSAQQRLFDTKAEGALDVSMAFRDVLSRSLSKVPDSRWQIAARISELANRNISKDMLDKYCSANPDYALRAEDLPAVIHVTGSIEPAQVLLLPVGFEIVGPEDAKLVRLAKLEAKKRELDAEIARLKTETGTR